MATHYDILGVPPQSSVEDIRRAYLQLARELHPDRTGGAPPAEAERTARRMQEVNEAWRVLREPASRGAYDRWLLGAARPPRFARSEPAPPPRHALLDDDDDDDLDRPFNAPLATPGDIGVSVARALPWVAVGVILLAIFVFTAFAGGRGDPEGPETLIGQCVASRSGSAIVPVPCEGPNEGEVVLLVERASLCPDGSTSRGVEAGRWLCLQPHNDIPDAQTTLVP